VEGHLHAVR
jgi:hypothetical protein